MTTYTDKNTLYIRTGDATKEEVSDAIRSAIDRYEKIHNKKIKCNYMVNVVQSKDGNFFGISYVRVTNTEVYNMLLGLNPDGTERIEYEEIEEQEEQEEQQKNWSNFSLDDVSEMDWADCVDEWTAPTQKKKIVISHKKEPLMNLNCIRLGELAVGRAIVKDLDENQKHDVLVSKNVPTWINVDDIKKRFTPFSSDSKTKYKKTYNGRVNYITYPDVNIKNGNIYVRFCPSTRDAQFALLMMKKTVVKSKDNQVHTMIFSTGYNYIKK